jgi:PPP family 3-phenylpropionic acid transporter
MRLLYLVFFAANGIFFTYVNVYYSQIGLSGTHIGLIGTLSPMASIIGLTGFGMLNDRTGRTRLLLAIAIAGSGLTALLLSAAPSFAWIVPVACLMAALWNPIIPLLDSTTLSLLGQQSARYGSHRVWGTFGFILTTATVGTIIQQTGIRSMFYLFAVILAVLLAVAVRLPQQAVHVGGFSLHGVGRMLSQPAWRVLMASIFLLGLAFSGMFTFLSVSMSKMGASASLIGVSWMMAAVSEIPIMFFGAMLLRRVGAKRLVAVSFLLYAVRNVTYAIMPAPEWVIVINGVFGMAYGLYWVGAVSYINELAPPELRTTSQSLLTSTTSLATVVGAFLSGWLFDRIGASHLFYVLAGFSALALLMFVGGSRLLQPGNASSAHRPTDLQ